MRGPPFGRGVQEGVGSPGYILASTRIQLPPPRTSDHEVTMQVIQYRAI